MGQLVAESLRLYGARFWPSLALGIGPALTGVGLVTLPHPLAWALVPTFGTLLWAAAYVGACRLALAPPRENTGTALAVAGLAFLPLGITRADYVHALGSVAALVITLFLSGLVLVFLLHGFSSQGVHVAAPVSLLVLAPVLLLGTALLYVDQAARVVKSKTRPRRRGHADVHPALEPDASGRADAEVES